jgi:hypothetical protein
LLERRGERGHVLSVGEPYSLILKTNWIRVADALIQYNNGKIQMAKKKSDEFKIFIDSRPLHEPNEKTLRILPVAIIPSCSVVFEPMAGSSLPN